MLLLYTIINWESRVKNVYTNNQLKTVQKIEHNLAYMDYAKIFCLQFYWLFVLDINLVVKTEEGSDISQKSRKQAVYGIFLI